MTAITTKAPCLYRGPVRLQLHLESGTQTGNALVDENEYSVSQSPALFAACPFLFDENGVPLVLTGAELKNLGVGPRLFVGEWATLIYSEDQAGVNNGRALRYSGAFDVPADGMEMIMDGSEVIVDGTV